MLLAGCTSASGSDSARLKVVTTTGILADLVHNVGGDRVEVSSIVPAGGDPHSYEPTPKDATRVTEADVTFTNHLLLEQQSLIKTIDANARNKDLNISLAEASETYGAHVIPLVENIGLDVLWLGLRVRGEGAQRGATRTSEVRLSATKLEGPGSLVVYLTESLGEPRIYFNSADGLTAADTTSLPPAAHTHVNWAFSKPGTYRLTLTAALDNGDGRAIPLGEGTFTFAVGIDPHTVSGPGMTVLGEGHTDLTVDLDSGRLYTFNDVKGGGKQTEISAEQAVIDVPNRALVSVPDDARFAFLGQPGSQVHQLPQAVLGKHVHGEIDPHLWQDVENVKAYTQLIRDGLKRADPDGAATYDQNTKNYNQKLDELHKYVADQVGRIAAGNRQLITTHDAFGYLADAYGMTVAGFVVPNPAQEPSVQDIRKLTETIRNLKVPAVFMEPNLVQRASVLTQVAKDQNVRVCLLYGDTFDDKAPSYVDMMRHNADELRKCLGANQ
ncbi:anchored repeat ABC transporter, substrate-binding protein [Kibdelosporangium aridum]|uniref:Anchored repeat ABC transporter, substrate-binding protein n=2 Tax=Kibdelosporangium aridum TaxID=2030 RepID=A0A428Z2T1_KIBAR|nr:anchored repeat ABC transporter, substrate-binding protein [Kibdelosporangium aridum]